MIDTAHSQERERQPIEVKTIDDFVRLRAAWSKLPARPKVLASSDQAPAIDFPGQNTRLLLSGEESSGRMAIFEVILHPGFNAPEHHQRNEDEWWYILSGTIDITVGDVTTTVGPGASAFSPRGCAHSFRNTGTEPVRMITINAPAGHERFFEALKAARELDDRRPIMEAHDVVFHGKVVFDE